MAVHVSDPFLRLALHRARIRQCDQFAQRRGTDGQVKAVEGVLKVSDVTVDGGLQMYMKGEAYDVKREMWGVGRSSHFTHYVSRITLTAS